jgi:alcohol dehydrogenase (cytochrome c)
MKIYRSVFCWENRGLLMKCAFLLCCVAFAPAFRPANTFSAGIGLPGRRPSQKATGHVQPGVYTSAQARRGEALYAQSCASCHGARLEGVPAAQLAGEKFLAKWGAGNRTIDDLYYFTRTQMPDGHPESLNNQQYVDIIAYMLQRNGYADGGQELPADSAILAKIKLTRPAASGTQAAVPSSEPEAEPKMAAGSPAKGMGPSQQELNAAAGNSTDWLLSNHDYGGQRYVDLKQINQDNASLLRPVGMYQAGDTKQFHTNPVVYKGVMYITTPYSTIALDATSGKLRWRHNWKPKSVEGWPPNRGAAIKDGRLIRGTLDGYLLALDLDTGKELWNRKTVASEKQEGGFTMAPMLYQDLIIIGPAVSEEGIKGWVGAFRQDNGEPVWRFNTVPDEGEPGADSWGTSEARQHGGTAVWAPLSLDPDQSTVYVPVANPAPDMYGDSRPGANLYSCSMVALDARSGKLKWYYQAVPHDLHDYDITQVSPLFTAEVNGKTRKLIAVAGKDGMLHVLDRESHEPLYEVPVTTRTDADAAPTTAGTHACPGILGGVQWNGPAYNPLTGMLYVNAVDWCGKFAKAEELHTTEGRGFLGGSYTEDPVESSRGWLTAVDASTGAVRWRYQSGRPLLAAVTTTSGEVVFTGEVTGDMLALDARTGKVLYRFNTGGAMNGGVVTYSIEGKQYVAVATGSASAFWKVAPGSSTIIIFALP